MTISRSNLFDSAAHVTADVVPFVLCGGAGTRLWPISRRDVAKQLSPILGGASTFQHTLERFASMGRLGRACVITAPETRFIVADQARQVGIDVDIALEPEPRDTLAAVTLAALLAARHGPETVALVAPSDHLVPDTAAFAEAVEAAAAAARDGSIVLLGIRPDSPQTGMGYIVSGSETADGARAVERFVEKPAAAAAEALIADGALWNAGIFVFQAGAALAEIARHAPDAVASVRRALDGATEDLGALKLGEDFTATPRISFDNGVMEKTDRAVVVPAGFAWSDIGTWRQVWAQTPKDGDGNAVDGDVVLKASRGNYVRSGGRLVCALGVEGLAIVDTPDAVLVAPLDRSQEIKGLVGELAGRGRSEATTSARVHRPWGWYQSTDLGDRFRVKRIQVEPGKKLSLQRHYHRAEHWVVVRGTAEVTRDDETIVVSENESIYLPLGCVHRLANPGKIPVEIIEVQTGGYLEEDDIVRIEDDFGRN